jgi:hypothetical protein
MKVETTYFKQAVWFDKTDGALWSTSCLRSADKKKLLKRMRQVRPTVQLARFIR